MSEETKQLSLDEQLMDWLKEHSANLVYLAVGPKGGAVPVDNFLTAEGVRIPAGWTLTVTVVEAKR